MSTTSAKLPTNYSQVSGSWTTPANIETLATDYASIAIAAKSTTYELAGTTFGFSTAVLPDAAVITAVSLVVRWYLSSSSNAQEGIQPYISSTAGTNHAGTRTSAGVDTFDITNERPGGGSWQPSDFRDGTFTVRCRAVQGNTSQSRTYYFDYVTVEVTYDLNQDIGDGTDLTVAVPGLGTPVLEVFANTVDDLGDPSDFTLPAPTLGEPQLVDVAVFSATPPTLTWQNLGTPLFGQSHVLSAGAAPARVSPSNMTTDDLPAPYHASASTEYSSQLYFAFRAFNNNVEDFWASDAENYSLPAWIQIDLGGDYTVSSYKLTARSPLSYNSWYDWTLRGSADGIDWTNVVDTRTGQTWSGGETKEFTCASPASFRYWRFNITDTQSSFCAEIASIELWQGGGALIIAAPILGTPELTPQEFVNEDHLTPDNLAVPAPTFGTASLGQNHHVAADAINNAVPTFGQPALIDVAVFSGNSLTVAVPPLPTPALVDVAIFGSAGLTVAVPPLPTPALKDVAVFGSAGLTVAVPTFGSAGLGQAHKLSANAIGNAVPIIGQPVLGQAGEIAANPLTVDVPVLGQPQLGQNHHLAAAAIGNAVPTFGQPSLGLAAALIPLGLTPAVPVLGTPQLGQQHELSADALTPATPIIGTPALREMMVGEIDALSLSAGIPIFGTPALGRIRDRRLADLITMSKIVVPVELIGRAESSEDHVDGFDDR